MKNSKLVMATVAVAFLAGGVSASYAQDAMPKKKMMRRADGYRPLTVGGMKARPINRPANPGDAVAGVGAAVAAPFNAVGGVGGPIGFGGQVAGGAIGGATVLATAPINGLFGGPVGISPTAAPPLPIKARYARTGAVATTVDEGYSQEVPVDKSGPIYMIDNGGNDRVVTPFSLVAFPLTAATSVVTSPLRPAPVPHG